MLETLTESWSGRLKETVASLEIAVPPEGDNLDQDEEWAVVRVDGGWRRIRLHDYGDVFAVPGLYEKWTYGVFRCRSPQKVHELLLRCLRESGADPGELVVLDLGAGNGCIAEVLSRSGIEKFVGVDIFNEAAEAAERDRPGLYDDYFVGDLTRPAPDQGSVLDRYAFNCMTCVAALGFGDIPPEVYAEAYNRIEPGGWIAFTIKSDFVSEGDKSGFSTLIHRMLSEDVMRLEAREPYTHRVSTDGDELIYEAFVGRKRRDIPRAWVSYD